MNETLRALVQGDRDHVAHAFHVDRCLRGVAAMGPAQLRAVGTAHPPTSSYVFERDVLGGPRRTAGTETEDPSSRLGKCFGDRGKTPPDRIFDIGDMVAWIFIHEDQSRRMKD